MAVQVLAVSLVPEGVDSEASLADSLRRAKAGDLAAFERILICYQRQVLGTALRLLGNREDAQDAAQEVFLRLHKHLRKFDEAREFAPWLYRITVNVCLDLRRKRPHEVPIEEDPAAAETPDEGRGEQRQMLRNALLRLPEKERAAVVLRDLEGLSTREVARMLGSSESTVRSQISSARLKIKAAIERVRGRRS